MHTRTCRLIRIFAFALVISRLSLSTSASGSAASEHSPLRKVADIHLPGAAVRFDYQSLDKSHGRLYIAHMNTNQLVVFDIKNAKSWRTLTASPVFMGSGRYRTGQSLRIHHRRTHGDGGRYGDIENNRQSGHDQIPGWHRLAGAMQWQHPVTLQFPPYFYPLARILSRKAED
jgi:hypothetical protein